MRLKLAVILVLASLAVAFIAQNSAVVEISFLFWRASMSSALLILFSVLAGCLLGWVLHACFLHPKSRGELVYLR